jgi:hypothetical protein
MLLCSILLTKMQKYFPAHEPVQHLGAFTHNILKFIYLGFPITLQTF